MNRTYTVKEVAEILGYSTNTIYAFLKEGRLQGVRVGKGRFRIPQEEVDQLVGSNQANQIQNPAQTVISPVAQPEIQSLPQSLPKHIEEGQLDTGASFFDWFVSLTSIVFGLSLVVYIRHFDEFVTERFSSFILSMQVVFIASGIAIILADFLGKKGRLWRTVFNALIILDYLLVTLGLVLNGDKEAALIFGLLPFVMIIQQILQWQSIRSVFLYFLLLLLIYPAFLLLFPSPTQGSFGLINISLNSLTAVIIAIIWILFCLAGSILVLFFHKLHKMFILVASFTTSVILFCLALYYANGLYWARALFLIVVAIVAFAAPFWNELKVKSQHDKVAILSQFLTLVLILLLVVATVSLIQVSLRSQASGELSRILNTGQDVAGTTLNVSQTTIEAYAQNPLLVTAVTKNDSQSMQQLSRNIFNSSPYFRRILLINASGNILNIYPYTVLPYQNISFRDYFKQVVQTRSTYISQLFVTANNGTNVNVAVIATPIIDPNKNLSGVVVASIDFGVLRDRLNELVGGSGEGYFTIVDKSGLKIITSDNSGLYSKAGSSNPILKGVAGQQGIEEDVNAQGQKVLSAYGQIIKAGWGIEVVEPLVHIYTLSPNVNFMILFLAYISCLTVILYNHLKQKNLEKPGSS